MEDASIDRARALSQIRERVAEAAHRRGPGLEPVLIGVSKRQPIAAIRELAAAGLDAFGENYAQEFRDKRAALADLPALAWHFIGALQSNKVKLVVGDALIHTVDRARLIDAIERRAAQRSCTQEVLIEVQLAPEERKAGVAPDELPALLDHLAGCEHVVCTGLMTIPPVASELETRRYFASLRTLRDRLAASARRNVDLRHLSMGMSADFELAILEGATHVRVGTALFGPRPG